MLFPTALFFYKTSHSKLCRVISWLVYCIFCAVTFCNRRLWQESGCSCGDSSLLLMEKADVIFARPWCFYKKQLTLCITWDKVVKFRVQVSNLVNIWCHPPSSINTRCHLWTPGRTSSYHLTAAHCQNWYAIFLSSHLIDHDSYKDLALLFIVVISLHYIYAKHFIFLCFYCLN